MKIDIDDDIIGGKFQYSLPQLPISIPVIIKAIRVEGNGLLTFVKIWPFGGTGEVWVNAGDIW